jgi:peptidoglycan/LPS O-acetylase OafA/YrhL
VSPERPTRLTGLDGLRGLAAIAVAVLHVAFYTNHPHPMASVGDGLMQGLRLGVPLFFVLSGLLLYLPWVQATRGARPAPDVRAYALKRAARILPAYYVALIGATVILVPSHTRIPTGSQGLAIAALVQNWWPDASQKLDPPAWTLAVEASFYVVLPLIGIATVRWLRRERPQLLGCAALVALSIVANGVFVAIGKHGWHRTLPGTAYAFALGMALAVLYPRARRLGRGARIGLMAAGTLLVVADALSHEPARLPGYQVWQDVPAAVGFAAIVAAVAVGERNTILGSRPFRWVGQRSYGLYLWHFPVILLLVDEHALPHSTALAAVAVVGRALLAAALSWRFVERPILRRARELGARGRRRPARRRRTARMPRSARASTPARALLSTDEA